MAVTGDTQLSPTKQEVIAEIAQRALIAESVFMGTVKDVSSRARKGAETISFPKRSTRFTVENRASAAPGTTQDVDFEVDQLQLNVRAHIQWLIDSNDEIESTLDVQRENIEEASMEHAVDVDRKVIAEMELAAIDTAAGALNQDKVLEMRQILLQNKARANSLYLAVSPTEEAALLKIDPFVSMEQYGRAIIPNGVLGTLYGVKVIMTPELNPGQFFMYESEGLGIGFQKKPAFDEDKRPEYGVGAMLQVLDQKYGVKALQVGVPNAFQADGITAITAAQSALIVKDGN